MALDRGALAAVTDGLIEAALLGHDWSEPLLGFAEAAGAAGATLVRHDRAGPGATATHSEFMLATASIAEPARLYLRGEAPPDPRVRRVTPRIDEAFLADFDRFTPEELARDPFYEEFLRPIGFRWHACARLDDGLSHSQLFLSLKRQTARGHYAPAELAALRQVLRTVRVAASTASATRAAESRGRGRLLSQRGEALFEFDHRGEVIGTNDLGEALLAAPFTLRRRRLLAPFEAEQPCLDAALSAVLDDPPRAGLAVLGQPASQRRLVLRTLPVVGAARDIFGSVAAIGIVSTWGLPEGPPEPLVEALRAGFDLTQTEARVTALIGLGLAPRDTARQLGVGVGTVRNHLKAAFAKTGAARQAELAALVSMIRG
jgi:DNA-binding CsgD family transcriptional regulator